MNTQPKEPGQVAYEAYFCTTDWPLLTKAGKESWARVARAVLSSQWRPVSEPPEDPDSPVLLKGGRHFLAERPFSQRAANRTHWMHVPPVPELSPLASDKLEPTPRVNEAGGRESEPVRRETARAGTPASTTKAHAEPVGVGVSHAGDLEDMVARIFAVLAIVVEKHLPMLWRDQRDELIDILTGTTTKSDSGGVGQSCARNSGNESAKCAISREASGADTPIIAEPAAVTPSPMTPAERESINEFYESHCEPPASPAVTPFDPDARRARFEDLFQLIDKRRYRDLHGWPGEYRNHYTQGAWRGYLAGLQDQTKP